MGQEGMPGWIAMAQRKRPWKMIAKVNGNEPIYFGLFTLPELPFFLVNTIQMVDFPWQW